MFSFVGQKEAVNGGASMNFQVEVGCVLASGAQSAFGIRLINERWINLAYGVC